LRICTGK